MALNMRDEEGSAAKCKHFAADPSEKRLLTPPRSNSARILRAKPFFSGFCKPEKYFATCPCEKTFSGKADTPNFAPFSAISPFFLVFAGQNKNSAAPLLVENYCYKGRLLPERTRRSRHFLLLKKGKNDRLLAGGRAVLCRAESRRYLINFLCRSDKNYQEGVTLCGEACIIIPNDM
ncbi:MAG: hypothetical protein HFG27_07240 [Provencibacterium sp.]|nr:hypothetical protein [Provencibacterium sp.]